MFKSKVIGEAIAVLVSCQYLGSNTLNTMLMVAILHTQDERDSMLIT